MTLEALPLMIAVFAGSVLQAGVGIGFSIVVAPFMMIKLGTATAIPLLLLLNTLVSLAAIDWASWRAEADVIRYSIVGALGGIFGGLAIYPLLSEAMLLSLAASFLFIGLVVSFVPRLPLIGTRGIVTVAGASGMTTAWAAMPGPLMVIGLLASGRTSGQARVLVQPIAFVAYGVAFTLHGLTNWSLVSEAPWLVTFVATTIAGALLGRMVGGYLPLPVIKFSTRIISVFACIALVRRAIQLG